MGKVFFFAICFRSLREAKQKIEMFCNILLYFYRQRHGALCRQFLFGFDLLITEIKMALRNENELTWIPVIGLQFT